MATLCAEGICVGTGGLRLRNIDWCVASHTLWAILGPNGSGKTTLLRAVLGLEAPSAGRILLDGAPLPPPETAARARLLSWVPQELAPGDELTVRRLMMLGRSPWGDAASPSTAARVTALAGAHGLEGLLERPVTALSGGERRRAYLCRMELQDTPFVFLDEPTSSLDPGAQAVVLDAARARVQRGAGAALVLHDLQWVESHATHVLMLHRGEIVARGPSGEVMTVDNLTRCFGVEFEEARTAQGRRAFLPRR